MTIKEQIKKGIKDHRNQKKMLWNQFVGRSKNYSRALGLSGGDLTTLRDIPNIIPPITVDGETFEFSVNSVCGAYYGDEWAEYITCRCTSNEALNMSTGRETTFISVVPYDWHKKIINYLRDN